MIACGCDCSAHAALPAAPRNPRAAVTPPSTGLPVTGCAKHQLRGMQRLAPERLQHRALRGRRAGGELPASAIQRIAHQRMTDVRQVHADLVRASGLQGHAQQAVLRESLDQPVVRDGFASIGAHGHAQPVGAMPADGLVHGAAAGHRAHAQRHVLALHVVFAQRLDQCRVGLEVRATTSRPLVSLSMRCTMPARGTPASFGSSASSAFCRVCARFPAPGCTTSPAGLSITKKCRSRKAIVNGMRFRLHVGRRACACARTTHGLAAIDRIARPRRRAVDGHGACLHPRRQPRTGILRQCGSQGLVEALARRAFRQDQLCT